jgi:hypothetical protein
MDLPRPTTHSPHQSDGGPELRVEGRETGRTLERKSKSVLLVKPLRVDSRHVMQVQI